MLSNHKLITIGAVLAVAVSGIALAETIPTDHSTGPDQTQQTVPSGQHPMGPDHMRQRMGSGQSPIGPGTCRK